MPARYRLAALAAALLVPLAASAQSTVYRWVDKDGKVQYSDTPPTQGPKDLQQKRMGGGYVDSTQLPYAMQIAVRKSPVTLFTGAACGEPCKQGRDLLGKRGVPFTERDAQGNPQDADALKGLVGSLVVPVLAVGSATLKGFEEGMWNSALDEAGYPRAVLPGQVPARPPGQADATAAPPVAPAAPPVATAAPAPR
jgi:hypothetical protein